MRPGGRRTWTGALRPLALLLGLGLVAGLVEATPPASASGAAKPWTPPRGAVFNDPTGGYAARTRIVRRVNDAIKHTPKGAVIRIATYNFDRADTANLLIRAYRRGVHVQVVANDNLKSPVEAKMRRVFGTHRRASSFFVFCKGACRTKGNGNLHIKISSFSQTGAAKDVVISSSANIGGAASRGQWNDAYTIVGDAGLFNVWRTLFNQLKLDRPATPRRVSYVRGPLAAAFQRRSAERRSGGARASRVVSTRARKGSGDVVLDRLNRIACHAPTGYGTHGHTSIRIIMYAWYGARGERLARKIAHLKRVGCDVRVIGSVIGDPEVDILQGAGIRVRAADWDWGTKQATSGDHEVYGSKCYSHLKVMTVNGSYRGKGVRLVMTGSENWSPPSFGNDEVTLLIDSASTLRTYLAQFRRMWRSAKVTHPVKEQPTSRPCR